MWWYRKENVIKKKRVKHCTVFLYATTEMLWQIVVLKKEEIIYTKAYVFTPRVKAQVCLQGRREFKAVVHKLWKNEPLYL